jgi:hypothetical protein
MNDETRKKYLDFLRSNPLYQKSLKAITETSEKAKAEALAEDVFVKLIEGLTVMQKIAEDNPEKMAEAAKKRIDKK